MSYGYITRGPMAADAFEAHFTRIANQLFRDARLSFKAKGIFGLISTHRDGYGLSMESIAAASTDGVSAVRTGLKELERFGYLVRERDRNEAGRLGQTRYWITDMPDGLVITLTPDTAADRQRTQPPRSQPGCEDRTQGSGGENPSSRPGCDLPHVAGPPEEDHRGKKTISQKINSLPAAERADAEEREAASPGDEPAAAVAAAWAARRTELGRPVPVMAPAKIAAAAARLLAQGLDTGLLTAAAADMAAHDGWLDLARHLEHYTPPALPAQRAKAPAWCGTCNDGHEPLSLAERTREMPDGRVVRCPACHPAALAAS
ncbi:helix-turn-helix domain-containing protein [Streptomyces roseicoloratus]|uniref:helix-turn-helix domain-containing protein n=1 Tax=Streptomyces roseicoloratus TaxID=2508722 RepID=UPI001FEB1553|nr:helix-turn-helix domain-containing protein [Streptomyces roseicoloratus]